MLPEPEEATPISEEDLEPVASEPVRARVSTPPPLPPQARRSLPPSLPPNLPDGRPASLPPSATTPPPPAGHASHAPKVALPASHIARGAPQSGTWRIPEGRPSSVPPSLPSPPTTTPTSSPPESPTNELASLRNELADTRAHVARLRLQLRQRDDRIVELEREHAALAQRVAASADAASSAAQRIRELESELSAARAAAPKAQDDLKRIPGIGPAFERALHAAGITRFAQIATWTADELSAVATTLNVPTNRITRGAWIEHAQRLATEADEASEG